jgi:hypothetical protein
MPIVRKGFGIVCLGLSLLLGIGALALARIPGPSGSPPHPDALGGITIMASLAALLLIAGSRLVRKRRVEPATTTEPAAPDA